MAANKEDLKKRGGRYCVAGTPNQESCKNTSYTPGICFPLSQNVGLSGFRASQSTDVTLRHKPLYDPLLVPSL